MDNNNKLQITISAFGKFGNVTTNPTSVIVSEFTEEFQKKYNIIHSEVLEVSTVACEKYLKSLPNHTLNLHFGVYDGSQEFNIEQCGYNLKDFGIPDMKGYLAHNECIEQECEKDQCRQTKINTDLLVEKLQEKFPVEESTDPGRYICNYIYYCSLQKSHGCPKSACLFIHFPAFRTIPKNIQVDFVENLLITLHKLYESGRLYK